MKGRGPLYEKKNCVIRNTDMAKKEPVRIEFTDIVEKIVQILLREGFIKNARRTRVDAFDQWKGIPDDSHDEEDGPLWNEEASESDSESDEDDPRRKRRLILSFADDNPFP